MRRIDFIHAFAGALVTISVLLGYLYSPYWFILTFFVGINLFQFGFTKWCLLEKILKRSGMGD